MKKETKPGKAMDLCLPCIVDLEEAGYEVDVLQEDKITCGVCGKTLWGRKCSVVKGAAG